MSVMESLWPEMIPYTHPEPVRILEEQGIALARQTENQLFGEVLDNPLPDDERARYDFYLRVMEKPHRFLLLSVECAFASDYPVVVISYTGENHIVTGRKAFQDALRRIFNSETTQEILQHMLSLSKINITSYIFDINGQIIGVFERDGEKLKQEILRAITSKGEVFVSDEAIEDALHLSDTHAVESFVEQFSKESGLNFEADIIRSRYRIFKRN